MKRGAALARRAPLRARPRARALEPGEAEWKAERYGFCAVCGLWGRLVLHHVLRERLVRRAGGDPWDQRNAVQIGAPLAWGGSCHCHDGHHHPGVNDTRIPLPLIPDEAIAFTVDLLGEHGAADYFARAYALEVDAGLRWQP